MEYFGPVTRRAQAVSELPSGGQLLVDSETFRGVHAHLNRLCTEVTAAVGAKRAKVLLGEWGAPCGGQRPRTQGSIQLARYERAAAGQWPLDLSYSLTETIHEGVRLPDHFIGRGAPCAGPGVGGAGQTRGGAGQALEWQ